MKMKNGNWPLRKLGDSEVCLLNPKKSEIAKIPASTSVSFVPMAQVDEVSGTMNSSDVKLLGDVRKGYTYFAEGDVVFAKITPCMENGKSAIARGLTNGIGFGTTEFHILRPGHVALPEWIHFFLRQPCFREEAKKNMHGASGQQRVPTDFLREVQIPVPPLAEQRRIVARIEELTRRAEEAKKLRQEALKRSASQFFQVRRRCFESLSSEWPLVPLGKCGKVMGGGTPSKKEAAYWKGNIPWIAPKEMKSFRITASSETISEAALMGSAAKMIPSGSVLFVVRGMILARVVPVALTDVPCAVNQDMKAIVPHEGVSAEYLAHMLWGANELLAGLVETAGHGTKKLETAKWSSVGIPIPDIATQHAVVKELQAFQVKLSELEKLQVETNNDLTIFQAALLAKAFRGEL